jgi:hypothetical protein
MLYTALTHHRLYKFGSLRKDMTRPHWQLFSLFLMSVRKSSPLPPPVVAKRPRLEPPIIVSPGNKPSSSGCSFPKKRKRKISKIENGSAEDVLLRDVKSLLGYETVQQLEEKNQLWDSPVQCGDILDLHVNELSSTGL